MAVLATACAVPDWCWRLVAGTCALELLAWRLNQPARDRLAALWRQRADDGQDS